MALTQTEVSELYVSIFNRASEGEGNQNWQNQNLSMAATATLMLDTDASKTYFGSSLDTNQAFIEHIYLNTLNKTATDDPNGITNWVNLLNSGKSRGEVVAEIIDAIHTYAPSGANYDANDTKTVEAYNQFNNRVMVSNHMADTIEKAPADYATSTAFHTSGNEGLIVTGNGSTVASADSVIDTMTQLPGETIVVSGGGLFEGTENNDTFLASRGEIDGATIKGKEGQDTLKATISSADDNNSALTSYDLETVQLRNTAGNTTIDLLEANGLQEVWNDRSSDLTSLTLDGVSTDVTVGIKKTSTTTTVNYEDVNGSDDAVNVKLDGSEEGAAFTATGVETLNLEVLSDSYLDISSNAGLTEVAITSTSATSIEVNGSSTMTITGGEGEDTVIINGALGSNLEMSNIENLAVTTTTSLDLDNVNVDKVISLDGTLTATNVEDETFVISGATAPSLVATLKDDSGATDAISVEVLKSAAVPTALTLNNIETLNIETNVESGVTGDVEINLTTSTTGSANQSQYLR